MANRKAIISKSDLRRVRDVAKEEGMTVAIQPDGTMVIVPIPDPVKIEPEKEGPRSWSE